MYRPLEPSAFFADGRSARPLEPGVIARGQLLEEDPMNTGLSPQGLAYARARRAQEGKQPEGNKGGDKKAGGQNMTEEPLGGAPNDPANFVNAFPFPMDEKELRRGMERYTIYCAVCHDPVGSARGKIVERGYLQPTNYHDESSRGFARFGREIPMRDVPVGYIFEVISHGFGGMPDYASQVPANDRWRIAAYVKVLQLSQHANVSELPPDQQRAARQALGEKK